MAHCRLTRGVFALAFAAVLVTPAGLRGPNAVAALRGPNAVAGLRGPNAVAALRGPNAAAALRGPNAVAAQAGNDPFLERQWNLDRIGATDAWEEATGKDVLIGIVDTGVESSHPDLAGKVVGSAVCLGGPCRDGGAEDDNGHGTEVAGIVTAVRGNGRGIAGVAPEAKLLVAKSLDATGAGRVDDINAGIRWAVDRGAKVVNLSLGDPDFLLTSMVGTPLRPGIEYAWTRGAVPVLASGNYRVGVVDTGASNYGDLNALVVAATDRRDGLPGYSSAIGNAKWGLAAPGGAGTPGGPENNVITTGRGGSYETVAGTSAAAPHVSGAVAVLLSMGLSPTAAVQRVLATLDRGSDCGPGCQGRLDLGAAAAGGGPPPAAPTAPRPDADGQPGSPMTVEGAPPGEPFLEARRQRAPGSDDDLNPAVVIVAAVLLLGAGGGVAVEWRRRLRAGGGW
ncbi:MAG TPA: S8 family serine peptidase [Acidimicrobiales bacterium]|nr:S8 family serine peptidase [Acidimicrobiales bacterium]